MGRSRATLEFGRTSLPPGDRRALPGRSLRGALASPGDAHRPPGDGPVFREFWRNWPAAPPPGKHALERGRLIDAYVDGHKYHLQQAGGGLWRRGSGGGAHLLPGGDRRAAGALRLRGQERPPQGGDGRGHRRPAAGAAAGPGRGGFLRDRRGRRRSGQPPDLLLGHSKGYHLARRWQLPLVRVGFPIHDRFGGHRILHLGYRGAQSLLDRIVNAVLARKQETSQVGYSYI